MRSQGCQRRASVSLTSLSARADPRCRGGKDPPGLSVGHYHPVFRDYVSTLYRAVSNEEDSHAAILRDDERHRSWHALAEADRGTMTHPERRQRSNIGFSAVDTRLHSEVHHLRCRGAVDAYNLGSETDYLQMSTKYDRAINRSE